MLFLIQIGFLTVTFWDFLDVLIVGYLLFKVYKLLKGSLAFNIFIGVILVYCAWWLVAFLGMPLLSSILGQFISVGIIALLILFQPEVRRFLLLVGQGSFEARFKFLERFLKQNPTIDSQNPIKEETIRAIIRAMEQMAQTKTGALIVISANSSLEGLYSSGVVLNADISTQLLCSIFNKESPLHDGAIIVRDNKIMAASCVLPVSENPKIPQKLGLRHRAAIGITEQTTALTFIVSEETGKISCARNGEIKTAISDEKMYQLLQKVLYVA